MNKGELISFAAKNSGSPKKVVEEVLNSLLAAITSSLTASEPVTLVGFGTFEVCDREERLGRNPRTGEQMIIPAKKAIKFSAGKNLKEAIQ